MAEAIFIRSDKGVRALQVDVVANGDQGALGIAEIDTSSGVGDNERFGAHPREHTNRKRDLLRRVAFVQMNTALHSRYRNTIHGSKDELSRMSDCRRSRKVRNLCVRNLLGIFQIHLRMRPILSRAPAQSLAATSFWKE